MEKKPKQNKQTETTLMIYSLKQKSREAFCFPSSHDFRTWNGLHVAEVTFGCETNRDFSRIFFSH